MTQSRSGKKRFLGYRVKYDRRGIAGTNEPEWVAMGTGVVTWDGALSEVRYRRNATCLVSGQKIRRTHAYRHVRIVSVWRIRRK